MRRISSRGRAALNKCRDGLELHILLFLLSAKNACPIMKDKYFIIQEETMMEQETEKKVPKIPLIAIIGGAYVMGALVNGARARKLVSEAYKAGVADTLMSMMVVNKK